MAENTIPVEAEFTLLKRNMKGNKVRGSARYRCALATLGHLVFPETGEFADAWIYNLSQNGIGLNSDRPLESQMSLVIHLKSPGRSFRLEGRVVHSTRQTDGSWRIGCELVDQLTPDMLDELL